MGYCNHCGHPRRGQTLLTRDRFVGRGHFKERGLHQNLCTKLVSFAAEQAGTMDVSAKQ